VIANGKGAPYREVHGIDTDLYLEIDQALADTAVAKSPAKGPVKKPVKK
jgi:hypothetical protein